MPRCLGKTPLHTSRSAARLRFGLVLTAVLFAAFALPAIASATKYPLKVNKTGTGKGVVKCEVAGSGTAGTCASSYLEGTELVLYATPNAGYVFVEWTDDYCFPYESEPCELTIEEEPVEVTAEFGPIPKYPLTVKLAGTGKGVVKCEVAGSGTAGTCASSYLEGTELVLYATPNPGSEFVEWTDDYCFFYGSEPCELIFEKEEEVAVVTAEFRSIPEYALTAKLAGTGKGVVKCEVAGSGTAGTCASSYLEGTELVLYATPSAGSEFVEWTGDCLNETCELTIEEEPLEVTAIFKARPLVSFVVIKSGTGTGTVSCDGGACASSYEQGTKVSLTASAASGSSFSGFSGGGCPGVISCVVTMNGPTAVTATFSANPQPTCATNVSLCPPGTAKAAATAMVKSGKAELKLTCSGGPCKGTIQLKAKVKQGKKTKTLVIGKASFSLAEGATATLKAKLLTAAKRELDRGKTLSARLGGTAIASSTVKLKPAKK